MKLSEGIWEKILNLQVAFHNSIWKKLGRSKSIVTAKFNAAHVHTQARYCHSSLGTKIKIERLGSLEYLPNYRAPYLTADNMKSHKKALRNFTKSHIGVADLMVYLVNDEEKRKGARGVSYRSVACTKSSLRYSVNEYQSSSALFGEVSQVFCLIFLELNLQFKFIWRHKNHRSIKEIEW